MRLFLKVLAIGLVLAGALGLWMSLTKSRTAEIPQSIGEFPGASVVIVTLDTTRADRLGCYGSEAGLTPVIDGLAQRGVLFEAAQSVAPVTLPSHTSILTGLYPIKHNVRNNGMFVLEDEFETLAEVFSDHGYATGAFVSAQVLAKRYGLVQGFDIYDDDLTSGRRFGHSMVPSRRGSQTLEVAKQWMAGVPDDQPLFLWLHFYDPHAPYAPPAEFRDRFPGDPYGGEIAFADALVGDLVGELEASGRMDNTIFTVLSDHGEGLGEHGERTHGFLLHQATIHVPWILTTPKTDAPIRITEPVSTVDLSPIVTALVGLDPPNKDITDGRVPFGRASRADTPESVYFEAMLPMFQYGWSELRGIRSGRWELHSGTRDELFNMYSDPRQLTDLSPVEPLDLEHMNTLLADYVEADSDLDFGAAQELPPSEREALAALGYLATTAPPRGDPPDPRDLVSSHVKVEQAQSHVVAGEFEEALASVDMMLSNDPENIAALNLKGRVLLMMRNFDQAEETFRRSLEIDPQNSDVVSGLCDLEMTRRNFEQVIELAELGKKTRSPFGVFDAVKARALLALERVDEADTVIASALEASPDDPDLLSMKAARLQANGNTDQAVAALQHALEGSPYHQRARRQLGALLKSTGRTEEALEVYQAMLRIQPDDAETYHEIGGLKLDADPGAAVPFLEEAVRLAPTRAKFLTVLGVAYIRTGRAAEAEAILRRAVDADPDDPTARSNLGIVLVQSRRYDEAIEELRKLLDRWPDFAAARNNLAIALGESGNLAGAEREVRQALEDQPEFLDGLLTLAAILDRNGRYEEEYAVLKRALPLSEGRADVRHRAAMCAAQVGRCARALELLEPDLNHPEVFFPDLNLAVATCLEKNGRIQLALRHFEAAAQKSPAGAKRDEAQNGLQRLGLRLKQGG